MTIYPVMFTFKDVVSGNAFLTGITLSGRALIYQSAEGEWWTDGIHPGGIAETGTSAMEAFSNFRNRYKETLFDIAEEAANFEAFDAEVKRFFSETDAAETARWNAALEVLRDGQVELEEPFSKLPRQDPEMRTCEVRVDRLDNIASNKFSAGQNESDKLVLPVAA